MTLRYLAHHLDFLGILLLRLQMPQKSNQS